MADTMTDAEQHAFETFALAYPHETYEADPEAFWTYFKKKCPNATREQMVEILKKTEADRGR